VETGAEPAFVEDGNEGFVRAVLAEAAERGIDPRSALARHTMRFRLA
jgi:hypothetical protein